MNISDQLRQLSELRNQGSLTEEEFADAKRKLLASDAADTSPESSAETVAAIPEKTYRSSRWSSGNLFFPDSLTLSSDGMVFRKGKFFGSSEEHINYRAVASIRVKNGIFLSTLSIETSGGSQPIFINGIWRSDSREIQDRLRVCQHNA